MERYHVIGGYLRLDPEGTVTSYADAQRALDAERERRLETIAMCDQLTSELATLQAQLRQVEQLVEAKEATVSEAIEEMTTPERIAEALKAVDYKYFGDYELSESQWDAIFVLCASAKALQTLRDERDRLRDALQAFCDEVEMDAAAMAYKCDLGAGEWESFIDRTKLYKQYLAGKAALTPAGQRWMERRAMP